MNPEPQKSNTILIIVTIISVIGTIVAAIIGAMTNYKIEELRQTSALTQVAWVAIATQGGGTQMVLENTINAPTQPPYPTYTPYPTITSVPSTATSIPTPTPDPRLFWDDFETGIKPEWGMIGQGYASTNGQLVVEGMLESGVIGDNTWGDYEIRVNEFGLAGCCTTVRFLIRVQDNNNYMQLTCREDNRDGYAECFWDKVVNGQEQSIPASMFGIMRDGDHILRVELKGSQYTTFWDGEQKMRFADNTFSNGGIALRINPRGKMGIIEVRTLP
jgi:hypothetical protein